MADKKKYLDQQGVSTLWSRIAQEIKKEETRAKGIEEGLRTDLDTTQTNLTNLTNFVGVLPEGRTEASVIAYIDEKAKETLAAASGNSTETAASVKQQLDDYKELVNPQLENHASRLGVIEGDYLKKADKDELAGDIADNVAAIAKNTAALATLNSGADVAGSVAHTATQIAAAKVAEIVADADADFDTLKEIADWILNDTTGAADMANDIAALQGQMAGIDTTVVAKIAAEIEAALKVEGVDKYALATDLSALGVRVKALEDADYQNSTQVGNAIDAKIAALKLAETYDAKGAAAAAQTAAETYAKNYADGLAKNYDAAGSAAAAETAAKAYADGLAKNYDAAGAATDALSSAKSWVTEQDYATEAYSDANLATAKSYSDTNLATAKSYADDLYAKIIPLTADEINAAITNAMNAQG